jgi:hypothetical protein
MGMDVYGSKPMSKTGEYFRNSCWWWPTLWQYCETVAPELCNKVAYAHMNDGDGLGAGDSAKLAERLLAEIESGRTAAWAASLPARIDALPPKTCRLCIGIGIGLKETCLRCKGEGYIKHKVEDFPFSAENVQAFAAFLTDCGGFEIW